MEEILAHTPTRTPTWKTAVEFDDYFAGSSVTEKTETCVSISKKTPELIAKKLGLNVNEVVCILAKSKRYVIAQNHLYLLINGKVKPFSDLFSQNINHVNRPFFYVYIPRQYASEETTAKIVSLIRSQKR